MVCFWDWINLKNYVTWILYTGAVKKNISQELSLISCEIIPCLLKTEMSHSLTFHFFFFLAICWRNFPRQTSPLPLPLICQACPFPPNQWSVSTCWAGGCPLLSVGSLPLSVWIITQNLTSKFLLDKSYIHVSMWLVFYLRTIRILSFEYFDECSIKLLKIIYFKNFWFGSTCTRKFIVFGIKY